MIVHPKWVYLHIPKTAGKFTEQFLLSAFPDAKRYVRDHDSVSEVYGPYKQFFANIRNPWDWYASRYYHGRKIDGYWFKVFGVGNKDISFKEFVLNMLEPSRIRVSFGPVGDHPIPVGTKLGHQNNWRVQVPVLDYLTNLDIGMYTFWYIHTLFRKHEKIFAGSLNVFKNHDRLITAKKVCRCESLVEDMIRAMNLTKKQQGRLKKASPRNTVKRPETNSLYDSELVDLIKHKDRLIVEKYKYTYGK